MRMLQNLKIGTKLSLGFGTLVLLMLVLAAMSLLRLTAISDAVRNQEVVQQQKLDPLFAAREALAQTGLAARNAFIFSDPQQAAKELAILDEQKAIYLAKLDRARRRASPATRNSTRSAKGLLVMAGALERPRAFREARPDGRIRRIPGQRLQPAAPPDRGRHRRAAQIGRQPKSPMPTNRRTACSTSPFTWSRA